MTFLTVTLAVAIGSFVGNFLLIYVIGRIVQIAEMKKAKIIQNQLLERQQQIANAVVKEHERMQKYAELEGYPRE